MVYRKQNKNHLNFFCVLLYDQKTDSKLNFKIYST